MNEMDIFSTDSVESIEMPELEGVDIPDDIIITDGDKIEIDNPEEVENTQINNTKEKEEDLIELPGFEDPEENKDIDNIKDTPPDKQKNTDTSNILSSFVNSLSEEGILKLEEGKEITAVEDLYDAIQDEKDRYFKDQLDLLPETAYKEALEAVRAGIPVADVLNHQVAQESYSNIADSDIEAESDAGADLRKQILLAGFMSKGYSKAKAEKYADKLIVDGDDVEEAKETLSELKASETSKFDKQKEDLIKTKQLEETKRVETLKKFSENLNETKEIIPGHRLSPQMKKKLYDGMTKGVATVDTPDGKQSVDIVNKFLMDNGTDGRLFLSYIIEMTNGGKNKELISTKKAKKEATKIFESQLENNTDANFAKHSTSNFDKEDLWNYV